MKILKSILKYILFSISLLILIISIYLTCFHNPTTFEQLLYSIFYVEGTSLSAIIPGALFVTCIMLTILTIIYISNYFLKNNKFYIKIKSSSTILLIIFSIVSILISMKLLKIDKYIDSQLNPSKLFEKYYVDGKNINITFPEQKQNLIHIVVESLENASFSISNGGVTEESYIPNLEMIAKNNINFSNNELLGGAQQVNGTGWTAAALISLTSGTPLKLIVDHNSYSNYGESLPGVYSIGEVLEDNGYKNYFMLGSDVTFGGRKDYFTYHGNYEIYDYVYAIQKKWIDEDYYVWWGYEDNKLYEFAKKQLATIASKEEPFNFTLLTADTHFTDGYLDESCPELFDSEYANSFYCTDIMLSNFINWIQQQDFYKNTTIVITGDHITMQKNFYKDIDDNYTRTIYNAILNSKNTTNNTKNRVFTSFDLYPTILSSLGAKIENERIGLGTNLFSNIPTLPEELGIEYFDKELDKKSIYYNEKLLGDTYDKMADKLNSKLKKYNIEIK